jgi:hypothetical protein
VFCRNCGRPLDGHEKFCPGCGSPISNETERPAAEKAVKKNWVLFFVPIIIAAGFLIFLACMLFGNRGNAQVSPEAQARYDLNMEITDQVDSIISPYVNEEGLFEYGNETAIKEAGLAVYDYAMELADRGKIEDAGWCEEGYSVSFFLNDGSTSLYLPSIEDAMSGGNGFGVASFPLISAFESIGYDEPCDTIADSIGGFDRYEFDKDVTLSELKDFLGSMNENHIRAVFWQGHGGIFKDKNGDNFLVLTTRDKVTPEKETLYAVDRAATSDGTPQIAYICNEENTYGITYKFFEKYTSQVDGGLFFCGACSSNADNGMMCSTLLDKGFDAYVGTSGVIAQIYSNQVLSKTASYLTQMEDGQYIDIEIALDRAVRDFEGGISEKGNNFQGGAQFELSKRSDFRLVEVPVAVTVNFDNEKIAPALLAIHCLKIKEDGTTEIYEHNISGSDLENNNTFYLSEIDPNDACQIDIYYGRWLLKSATVYRSDMIFENGMYNTEIDIEAGEVYITPEDVNGNFLSDVKVQVFADDDDNGIIGLIQEPVLDRDKDAFYITLAQGDYNVKIILDDGQETKETNTVIGGAPNYWSYVINDGYSREETEEPPEESSEESTEIPSYGEYTDVIRQYEDKYGKLQFSETEYGTNYTGVFLLEMEDFDVDGTEELIIGYSVPNPVGDEYSPLPALDVWTIEDKKAVCLYEGAYVQQSDIGQHCLYTYVDGVCYLVTGWSGSDLDLQLLSLQDGEFVMENNLRSVEISEGVYVTGTEYYLAGNEVSYEEFSAMEDKIYAAEMYDGILYEHDHLTPEEMESEAGEVKDFLGIEY